MVDRSIVNLRETIKIAQRVKMASPSRSGSSFFTSESDNKGFSLMRNMGWSEGKGLGRNNQGQTAHIKIKV